MQFKEKIEGLRHAFEQDKKYFLAIALIALVGAGLRLFLINKTDISGDEVFFASYAYKIAFILWSNPVIAIGLALAMALLAYAIIVKRNAYVAAGFAIAILAAKYGLGLPYLAHTVGPVYILATAATIYLTNLVPNIAGELVSSLSMIGLAFVALYLGSRWNKAVGFCAFTLVMLSPYNVFMSTTSFVSPLGMFLLFSSVVAFFKGMQDTRFLPLAGVLAALAYATRFPTIVSLPVFAALVFMNRESLLKKQNRKNLAVFSVIVLSTVLFLIPLYEQQFHSADTWYDSSGTGKWELTEAHLSAFVAQAADPNIPPNQDHFFILRAMNLFYSPLFLLLLAIAIPFGAYKALKEKDARLAAILFIGLAIFLAFFIKLAPHQRINRGLGYEFPFIMLVSFMLCSGKRFFEAKRLLAILLGGIFLVGSLNVITVHDFTGLSDFVESIPDESIVFSKFASYQVSYYRGLYKYDVSIRKAFFDKIVKPNQEKDALFRQKQQAIVTGLEWLENADYALVKETLLTKETLEKLQPFMECQPIDNGGQTMFKVYAKQECP